MTHHHPEQATPTAWTERIMLGGFESFSTVDWPGKLAATVFLRGCPWRCAYCHNPHLQKRSRDRQFVWETIAGELAKRRGWLDGVVFSGGEPTADATLPEAIAAVRELGFAVGLHTGGSYPERLAAVLPLLDWVGFDLKTDYEHYDALTGAPGSGSRVTQSARLLVANGVAHEFRLTWHPQVVGLDSALLAVHFAQSLGASRFVLQQYRTEGVAEDTALTPYAPIPLRLVEEARALFDHFEVRGEVCALAGEINSTPDQG